MGNLVPLASRIRLSIQLHPFRYSRQRQIDTARMNGSRSGSSGSNLSLTHCPWFGLCNRHIKSLTTRIIAGAGHTWAYPHLKDSQITAVLLFTFPRQHRTHQPWCDGAKSHWVQAEQTLRVLPPLRFQGLRRWCDFSWQSKVPQQLIYPVFDSGRYCDAVTPSERVQVQIVTLKEGLKEYNWVQPWL